MIPTNSMHESDVDLDAYFARIGYTGTREPTLEVLRGIVLQHTQTIAYENLNPLLGWPVELDRAALQHKLVRMGRGGYCYEQNGLLSQMIQALGFSVRHLAARVLWNRVIATPPPRTHMLLCVTIDAQPYLVDVGFGGMTPTDVLRFETDTVQSTLHESYRLLRVGEEFRLEACVRDEWKPTYRFDLQEQVPADYEVANWYVSRHPQSRFVTNLNVARPGSDRRYALFNTQLSIYHNSGQTEQYTLTSVTALRDTLQHTFLLTLPDDPALDLALQHLLVQAGS